MPRPFEGALTPLDRRYLGVDVMPADIENRGGYYPPTIASTATEAVSLFHGAGPRYLIGIHLQGGGAVKAA